MKVQRRKSLKYGDRQHYEYYITIPVEFSRRLGLERNQEMECYINSKGALTYTKAEKKTNNKMIYAEWISILRQFTPEFSEGGKTYRQICKEGGIPLKSAPAFWVKLAETDIGLIRKLDSRTHRILWMKALPRLRDTKLTEPLHSTETSTRSH